MFQKKTIVYLLSDSSPDHFYFFSFMICLQFKLNPKIFFPGYRSSVKIFSHFLKLTEIDNTFLLRPCKLKLMHL